MKRSYWLGVVAVLSVFGAATASQQTGRGAQAPGATPATTTPLPPAKLPTDLHPDISGIWNRLDTAGSGSWSGITFENAQLQAGYRCEASPAAVRRRWPRTPWIRTATV